MFNGTTNPKVKKLLKSVHICQSYRKNKCGTIFYGPRCMSTIFTLQTRRCNLWILIFARHWKAK